MCKSLLIFEPDNIYETHGIFDRQRWFDYVGEFVQFTIEWIRTVHNHMGDVLVKFFERITKKIMHQITYSGGVAQNVIWNTKQNKFPNLIKTVMM